VAHWIFLAPS